MSNKIDHIVYSVPDMEMAIQYFEDKLGVTPIMGGRHLAQGTKNALLRIGQNAYLEILSVDPENNDIQAPRWMGIDLIQAPTITRWCLKTADIYKDAIIISSMDPQLGQVMEGRRSKPTGELLEWKLTSTKAIPAIEITPFLIDWSSSTSHPTSGLSADCHFVNMELYHPDPDPLNSILQQLDTSYRIRWGTSPEIKVTLEGPTGIVHL